MYWSEYVDEEVAKNVHEQFNCVGITENAVIPKEKENYRPRTLVDQTLEFIDPTPNIYTLFVQFNENFFWNVLLPVQVKWSPRMTSCAGICSFHPRNRECVISLSTPLLKLRPRKDLIETLLHEMIHAYLFLTNNNRDRDGHGPIFQSHMNRINREAGTNISIYHDFHDEVRLYQQHWWRCDGPCQKRAPYFGMVRRAMNRAPGPNDNWWKEHQLTCGGRFIKVREPEKPDPKQIKKKTVGTGGVVAKPPSNNSSILDWVNNKGNNGNKKVPPKPTNQPPLTNWNKNNKPLPATVSTDLTKLGNSTNNVFGWGVGGPNSTSSSGGGSKFTPSKSLVSNPGKTGNVAFTFSGTLGGSGTGKSKLLDKFPAVPATTTPIRTKMSPSKNKSPAESNSRTNLPSTSKGSNDYSNKNTKVIVRVNCPNCSRSVDEAKINEHLDACLLEDSNELEIVPSTSDKKRKNESDDPTPIKMPKIDLVESESDRVECPLCNKKVALDKFNDHMDNCLRQDSDDKTDKSDDVVLLDDSGSSSVNLQDSPHVCLICNEPLKPNETLNMHLEVCVASVFNDSEADNNDDDNQLETAQSDEPQVLDRYPCPVCMELVKQAEMNEHLDVCIGE